MGLTSKPIPRALSAIDRSPSIAVAKRSLNPARPIIGASPDMCQALFARASRFPGFDTSWKSHYLLAISYDIISYNIYPAYSILDYTKTIFSWKLIQR